ncbi:helix-turn-helix domain-containing protein [Nocardia sp. NPDC127579]|uniref:helix-turn-helix domain-containing protein n=1 Tax=Nocardia sp. NPDC127579 TaxID=3345402 RepID=UPI0036439052
MPNAQESTPTLIALARASEMLGISPKTMRRWISEQKIPAYRVSGHAIRVDRADVLKLIVRIPVAEVEA